MYKLDNVVSDFKKYTTNYRFDLMANSIYEFVWNEYCDWYLEVSKNNINETTKSFLIYSIIRIIKVCHPIIPFITEEIWSELYKKGFVDDARLINSSFPSQIRISREDTINSRVDLLKDIIRKIRKTRTELGIHPKDTFETIIYINEKDLMKDVKDNTYLINSLANIKLSISDQKQESANEYIDLIDDKYILYLSLRDMIDIKSELIKIEKKISQMKNILNKVNLKLNNKSFIERAPSEIINQNIANKNKIENDILSLENLRITLSN